MESAQLITNISLLGFGISAVLNLLSYRLQKSDLIFKVAFLFFLLSTVGIGIAIAQALDITNTTSKASLILTFVICTLAVLGHIKYKTKTITTFIAPIATLILIIQSYIVPLPIAEGTQHLYPQKFLSAHIYLAICGQSFSILTSGIGIIYLWQRRNLKKKLLNALSPKVPALDRLEWLLTNGLWVGFSFLTAGLISGAIYTSMWSQGGSSAVKLTWAVVVWLWYFITILSHSVFKVSMKRTAQMTVFGFILLATTFFGISAISFQGGS